jgi:pimeloyl-ACP methyl ester carboxylesterase
MTPSGTVLRPAAAALLALLAACGVQPPAAPALDYDRSGLPAPDLALGIARFGPCTDAPDRTLRLAAGEPVTVFVHGCYDSAGLFRSLAEVFAFHGQQTACFDYDYRDSLADSAAQLREGLAQLASALGAAQVTVVGHSQGGLIARAGLVDPRGPGPAPDLRLVTVSAPFAGIASAAPCGWNWLTAGTLGLHALACWAVSGDKWHEITDSSDFIRRPGPLAAGVRDFLKIDTDEAGSCRRRDASGACAEDDYVFSLREQDNPAVGAGARLTALTVKAGHTEIVGDRNVAPEKLIGLLQQQGVLRPTAPARREALERLLARLYLE